MKAECLFNDDPWKIIEDSFDLESNPFRESIFSLANEYMGTRGNFEEGLPEKTSEGCFIGGIYNKERISYTWKRVGFPTFANSMMHTINWLTIQIEVDDECFEMSRSQFDQYQRQLDMKQGLLQRELLYTTLKKHQTQLTWERFISNHDKHLGAIRFTVKAINHEQPIRVRFLLDGAKENSHYSNAIIHTEILDSRINKNQTWMLKKVRTTGQYYIAGMQVRKSSYFNGQCKVFEEESRKGVTFSWKPTKDQEMYFDKIVSIHTSRDLGFPFGLIDKESDSTYVDPEKEAQVVNDLKTLCLEHLHSLKDISYGDLRVNHINVLKEIWNHLDIEIEGDTTSQQGIRYSMFQLFNTYQGHDGFLNIGAKGYTGETYEGRYFWDSEAYCLPFYLLTNPDAAKKLLEYRYNTLDGARAKAKAHLHNGAWYPWQTIDGTEDCGIWEYSFGEVHINGIIPYAINHYTQITQDKDFLYSKGIEILLEQCRFWASRCSYMPFRKGYGILKCMGPDEHQQVIDNNYYTNYLAKWSLEYTLQVIEEMKKESSNQLNAVFQKITFDEKECELWTKIADQMVLPYNDELQIRVQDDSFLSLEGFTREMLDRDRDIPIKEKWTIENLQRYPLIKQPDILLMMFLFRDKFSLEEKKRHYQFYEQQTIHESSLSPSIHSILATEVGMLNQAYDYYLWSSRLDMDNCNRNSHQGLHISSMAGSWMNIVFGFGGLQFSNDRLVLNPSLPQAWKKLSFKIVFRGNQLQFTFHKNQIECCLIGEQNTKPVNLIIDKKLIVLSKDKTVYTQSLVPKMPIKPKAVIFDLDGVICDTAEYHYLAWKAIADEEDIYFDQHINERLKGVSRLKSLEILMERRNRDYSKDELANLAEKKNDIYKDYLKQLSPQDMLVGIADFVNNLKEKGFKLAICSASKNAPAILDYLQAKEWFDTIVSGNDPVEPKPHPDGFLLAAERLGVEPKECVVVEDAFAGIQAAKQAGMKTLGIGHKLVLHNADYTLPSTQYLSLERIHLLY